METEKKCQKCGVTVVPNFPVINGLTLYNILRYRCNHCKFAWCEDVINVVTERQETYD